MREIIPVAKQLMQRQEAAWQIGSDTSPLLLGTASLLLVFGLLMFIRRSIIWHEPS